MALMRSVQRRLATGINALLVVALGLATVGVLMQVTHENRVRFDVSAQRQASLSDDLLAAIRWVETRDAELRVTAFSAQARNDEAWLRNRTVRGFLEDLGQQSERRSDTVCGL